MSSGFWMRQWMRYFGKMHDLITWELKMCREEAVKMGNFTAFVGADWLEKT